VIRPDLQTLFCIQDGPPIPLTLSRLCLDPTTDTVTSIGFLTPDRDVFLFVARRKAPVLFFVRRDSDRFRSLALNSLSFHSNVLDTFSPYTGTFCIISREGLSLHTLDLDCLFELRFTVTGYCFWGEFIAAGSPASITIHQFASGSHYELLKFDPDVLGFPRMIYANNQVLTLVSGSDPIVVHVIPYISKTTNCAFLPQKHILPQREDASVSFYDDGLIVGTSSESHFLDLLLPDHTIAIGTLPLPNAIVFGDDHVFSGSKYYRIAPDYEAIENVESIEVVSALLRRRNGLHAAIHVLKDILSSVKSVDAIEQICRSVGRFAVSPVAQIRYTRALQFSGIKNIHLLLLALVEFVKTRKFVISNEALAPLLSLLTNEECKFLFGDLFRAWGMKLNRSAIVAIAKKFDDGFRIDQLFVEDPLDLADVCIQFGRAGQARSILMREVLNENPHVFRLAEVARQYIEAFGDTKTRTVQAIIGRCQAGPGRRKSDK
jgi:hypothetical protein